MSPNLAHHVDPGIERQGRYRPPSKIGKQPPTTRSARWRAIADLPIGARGGPPHHRGHGERTVPIFIDRGAPPPVRHEAWSPLNRQPLKVGGEGVEPARAVV